MNKKSNYFNNKWCSGKLGCDDDTTDVEDLQSFSINFTFQEVPKNKVAKVLKEFLLKCMNKDTSISFHRTNNQTFPKPIPCST